MFNPDRRYYPGFFSDVSALTGLYERFSSFQTQYMRAHDQQRTFRITTAAATARNIRLIVEMIIALHTGIAYHIEYYQTWGNHNRLQFFK